MSRPKHQAIPKLYALTVVASAERTTTLQTDLPSVCFLFRVFRVILQQFYESVAVELLIALPSAPYEHMFSDDLW